MQASHQAGSRLAPATTAVITPACYLGAFDSLVRHWTRLNAGRGTCQNSLEKDLAYLKTMVKRLVCQTCDSRWRLAPACSSWLQLASNLLCSKPDVRRIFLDTRPAQPPSCRHTCWGTLEHHIKGFTRLFRVARKLFGWGWTN